MQIIKNRSIVEDNWQLLGADDPLQNGDIIVPFSRWQAEREQLLSHQGKLGVQISGGEDLKALAKDLQHFQLIALSFERFADGRCYSYARLLRERFSYTGELRAIGDVLHDQLAYMERCGIDSFVMRDDQNLAAALHAFGVFSDHYQTAADLAQPIQRQRHV